MRRLPFTLTTLAILITTAIWTQTHTERLMPNLLKRLGFATDDFWLLRWERLITSALITHGGRAFWGALFMVALAVGIAEKLTGTRRTFATFWGIHLLTLFILASTIGLLHRLGINLAPLNTASRDVGPSAGYMACLGLVVAQLPRPWRWIGTCSIMAALIGVLFVPASDDLEHAVKLSADVAHLIAFPAGFLSWLANKGT